MLQEIAKYSSVATRIIMRITMLHTDHWQRTSLSYSTRETPTRILLLAGAQEVVASVVLVIVWNTTLTTSSWATLRVTLFYLIKGVGISEVDMGILYSLLSHYYY